MSKLLFPLFVYYFLAIANCQPLQDTPANKFADDLISQMSSYINENKLAIQNLPNIHWGVGITFDAVRGQAYDFSTINRIGDADLKQSKEDPKVKYTFTLNFSFKTLTISYDYFANFLDIIPHLEGTFDIGFNNNQFELTSTILVSDKDCQVTAFNIVAQSLSDLSFNFTPDKYNPWWVQKPIQLIYNWFFSNMAVSYLNGNMEAILKNIPYDAYDASICSLLPNN